jgi:hypothetical protein
MAATEQAIRNIVQEVLAELGKRPTAGGPSSPVSRPSAPNGIPVRNSANAGSFARGPETGRGTLGVFQVRAELR